MFLRKRQNSEIMTGHASSAHDCPVMGHDLFRAGADCRSLLVKQTVELRRTRT
jgi:hypothetical protein